MAVKMEEWSLERVKRPEGVGGKSAGTEGTQALHLLGLLSPGKTGACNGRSEARWGCPSAVKGKGDSG